MKVTFFSNFLNHHQVPFCIEMHEKLGDKFTFVSTMKTPKWILDSGYNNYESTAYNLLAYDNDVNYQFALELCIHSDIVIHGSAPSIFLTKRLELNKHTFRYSERIFKKGKIRLLDPRVLWSLINNHFKYRNRNLYMLCASAYTSVDFKLVFSYPGKMYKWGYFTAVEQLDINSVMCSKQSKKTTILWVGRLIDWKHPELAIKLLFELKNKGYNVHLNMIGTGLLFDSIKRLIHKLDISDCVSLLGNLPNNEVRRVMLKTNIFLFTSDMNEGWGAVLNEAMSAGCAVVASDAIGSVPYLIKHGVNGLVFKSKSIDSLLHESLKLLNNNSYRDRMGVEAYTTMFNEWSPINASSNFLKLSQSIINKTNVVIPSGPCSLEIK